MPRLSRSRALQAATTVAAVVLAVVVWWIQQGDGGNGGGDAAQHPSGAQSQSQAQGQPGGGSSQRPTSRPTGPVDADMPARDEGGFSYVAVWQLPVEAAQTLSLIDSDGPFPYPGKDGSTFRNGEGRLPEHDRGYYAEYTVPTPGEGDRGARRIIRGDGGELYWTEDHYDSFERIWRGGTR